MVFNLAQACHVDGFWQMSASGPRGEVIGAMSKVGPASLGERSEMVGAYFRAAQAPLFTQVPARELTDRIVDLRDLPRTAYTGLAIELSETSGEESRLNLLESTLLKHMERRPGQAAAVNVPGLARRILSRGGRLTVQILANAVGVSRQHLARLFRESVGVTPKLYNRLARFQAALAYAGCGNKVDWAQVAIEMGYFDQSHMIGEFREFSSLTPEALALQRYFHPFIERARAGHRKRFAGYRVRE
jgi:AraC-like DNA-binding protein